MTYTLVRESDGAGDSGGMSTIFYQDENGEVKYENNARPRVGVAIRVGSIYGRTYSLHDYWTTTPITEIIEDTPDMVRFKTMNSEYVWAQK
jgi:hypothetical protein